MDNGWIEQVDCKIRTAIRNVNSLIKVEIAAMAFDDCIPIMLFSFCFAIGHVCVFFYIERKQFSPSLFSHSFSMPSLFLNGEKNRVSSVQFQLQKRHDFIVIFFFEKHMTNYFGVIYGPATSRPSLILALSFFSLILIFFAPKFVHFYCFVLGDCSSTVHATTVIDISIVSINMQWNVT